MKFKLVLILSVILLATECSKSDKEETEYSLPGKSEEQVAVKEVDYDSLRLLLDTLNQRVTNDIMNVEHRMTLVEAAYDTTEDIIYAIGRGKIPMNANPPEVAMRYAERAAELQAKRMAAYVKTWSLYPARIDTTPMIRYIPPGTIVSKQVTPDSTVEVLVKINAKDIMKVQ
ncbi:hypothetical protein JXB12_03795 [candidate division KSB1 bacterium]|nr:hypothetical protein [candidate division KSB1 bacterium]